MKSMAFRSVWRRFATPPTQQSPFSTLASYTNDFGDEHSTKARREASERFVLDELSELLPLDRSAEPRKSRVPEDRIGSREADEFLSPGDKLRGVFLQKLRGKTAIERALSDVGVVLSVDVVAEVVNRGNLDGEKIVAFFNWAIKDPAIPKEIDTYHVVLKALGRRKFLAHMVEILQSLKREGLSPNLETVSILADGLIKARRVSRAIQMFRNLDEIGLDRDTQSLNVFLECLCRRSHVGAANSLLHSMKQKIRFDSTTYNVVIRGWSKLGRVPEMERLLEAMVSDGVDPDGLTRSFLIEGLGRAGRVDEGTRVFESMTEPDTCIHNSLIANFAAAGNVHECLKRYEIMLSGRCEPDVETYATLIGALLKARKVADALEMFDEMLNRGIAPSMGTITSFIEALCSYGPPHAAMMVYKKAKGAGFAVSFSAHKLLLKRLAVFGKCGILLRVWNEMQSCGYSSDAEVYECVVDGLCNNGQLECAVLVMEECLQKGLFPSRLVCSRLSRGLIGSGKVERAYRLFLKLKEARKEENAQQYWRSKGWHF